MPVFSTLIDDGELIASDPGSEFVDLEDAMCAVLRTAATIAMERSQRIAGRQLFVCEVSDRSTGEHKLLELEIKALW